MERILAQHAQHPQRTAPLLNVLLSEDLHDDAEWCRDETAALLMSALEPMAAGLTWTLLLLAQHPHIAQALAEEADVALRAPSQTDAGTNAQLSLTKACIKEAMRLYPPAWMTARIAQRASTLGGFDVPAGTQLIVSQWVAHRDPRHFPDPDAFVPARWHAADGTQPLPRYAYFPFGGGPRSCIGGVLAVAQMTRVIACILHAYTLRLAPDAHPALFPALVLRPMDVRIALQPRTAPVLSPQPRSADPVPAPHVSDATHD